MENTQIVVPNGSLQKKFIESDYTGVPNSSLQKFAFASAFEVSQLLRPLVIRISRKSVSYPFSVHLGRDKFLDFTFIFDFLSYTFFQVQNYPQHHQLYKYRVI